jgi:UDP-N-acetylglucosamine 1-carboxyvinyltransferase
MEVVRIRGGNPLRGSLTVSGAKNAALPIMAATLLTRETCVLRNVPDLTDIRYFAEILQNLGARVVRQDAHTWEIQAEKITHVAPYELVRKMRASVCLIGPLVGRLRKAEVSLPGGCVIGQRPIDLHLKGLARMGSEVAVRNGYVHVDASKIEGTSVFLGGRHGSTVTGTANLVMTAVLTPGTTRIESAACEPEVEDLCRFLQTMGAQIEGVGSHTLTIRGVKELGGSDYAIIPDRIETGTYMVAAIMTGGEITLHQTEPNHLGALIDKLEEAGQPVEIGPDASITIRPAPQPLRPIDIITLPHPGFPTDLQAQMGALMSITKGLSIITERIYPSRFMHVPELQRMGADIAVEGPSVIIKGVERLSGAPVMASDLRASAALILAGLAASGETWVQRIYHLDRGYEGFDTKLASLGADITRLPQSALPAGYGLEGG